MGCNQISCANYGRIEDKCDITFKMGNMHLFQVHLKWANVWLLVVSAVIVAASPVVPHFLQVVPCTTSATLTHAKLNRQALSLKQNQHLVIPQ